MKNEQVLEIPEVTESGANNVPDFNTINVTLTYEDYQPWEFKFRRQLNAEQKQLKQEFYAMVQAEQDEKQHEMRVIMLAGLLKQAPEGVQGYLNTGSIASDFINYFRDKDENEDTVNWIWTVYQRKLYPKEVIATPSE